MILSVIFGEGGGGGVVECCAADTFLLRSEGRRTEESKNVILFQVSFRLPVPKLKSITLIEVPSAWPSPPIYQPKIHCCDTVHRTISAHSTRFVFLFV